jgi:hypothetical protein
MLLEIVIGGGLAAWFAASVLNQFSFRWFDRIRQRDAFSLLPIWSFFAPNPGQSDYHVVYRDRRADGSVSGWNEMDISDTRRPYSWLWNPEKRSKKVITDVVAMVAEASQSPGGATGLVLSIPYLLVLNVVNHLQAEPAATHRQFLIVETYGFVPVEPARALLQSDFHALARGGPR